MRRDGAKNMKEAVNWTRKAADAGYARAQCQLGLFYINGLGVDQDEDTTEEWLEKSAVADMCSHSIEPMVNTSE